MAREAKKLGIKLERGAQKPQIADKIFTQAGVEPFGMSQSLEKDEDKEFLLGSKDYPEFADSVAILPMISIDTRVLYITQYPFVKALTIFSFILNSCMAHFYLCTSGTRHGNLGYV